MVKVFVNDELVECSDAAANELIKLRADLVEREAEIAYLKDFIFDYVDIEPNNELAMAKYHRAVAPPITSYLEQWEKEKYGEPVAYETYKGYLLHAGDPKVTEHSDPTPLYARND